MKKRSSAPGPKFKKKTAKAGVLAEVAKLDMRGYPQTEIARLVGVSQPMVSAYLKQIRQQYHDARNRDAAEAIQEKLAQFRDVRNEAWLAWQKSWANVERSTEEQQLRTEYKYVQEDDGKVTKMPRGDKLKVIKLIKMVEGRLPGSQYLAIINTCLIEECKLEGLIDARTINNNQINVMAVDWSSMHGREPSAQVIDVQAEARALSAHPSSPGEANGQAKNGDGK